MDFWVVAAATGAGYVAKHWQNLSGEKDSSSNQTPVLSPRLQPDTHQVFDKMPNPVFPSPKSSRRWSFDGVVLSSKKVLPVSGLAPIFIEKDHNIMFMKENGSTCMNKEFFEPTGSMKLPRREKQNFDMVSLFIGITMGILSTSVNNQHELDQLNDLLEQAQNMVQHLHKKLEIKDGFTTKEPDGTAEENLELTSDIEAELEAELERLEENLNHDSVFPQIDSDMARGDLNLDSVVWEVDSQSEPDHDGKSEPVFTPNYAVSPLELRLRLHELIESELRSRIKDLESVLENHHQSPDLQEENTFWDFDHTRIESSSSSS